MWRRNDLYFTVQNSLTVTRQNKWCCNCLWLQRLFFRQNLKLKEKKKKSLAMWYLINWSSYVLFWFILPLSFLEFHRNMYQEILLWILYLNPCWFSDTSFGIFWTILDNSSVTMEVTHLVIYLFIFLTIYSLCSVYMKFGVHLQF